MVNPAVAVGYRIMREAGVLPEEFRLKRALDATRARYRRLTDDKARKATMAEIADLEMRYNIAVDARRRFHSN